MLSPPSKLDLQVLQRSQKPVLVLLRSIRSVVTQSKASVIATDGIAYTFV